MFFRLPVVRFFNRVINRAMVTVALVLLQIGWLLWAFFSLTAGKVWVNAGLNVLSQVSVSYFIFSEERPKRLAWARFHFSRITCICWFVCFSSFVRTASWLRSSFSCSILSRRSFRISFLFSFASCSSDKVSAIYAACPFIFMTSV